MKFAFLTYGLTAHNTHLMPWRYVLEIANGLIQMGHKAIIVSDTCKDRVPFDSTPVIQTGGKFSKQNTLYLECIKKFNPDVIYFPVARRCAISSMALFHDTIPHIAYFPSAWYKPGITFRMFRELPLKDAVTYVIESLIPGSILVKALREKNVRGIATISHHTTNHFIKCGWPESQIRVFPPGLDSIDADKLQARVFLKYLSRIAGTKYILFMGPAKAIRGIYFLLRAFDRAANAANDIKLVCLMRHDNNSEWQRLRNTVKNLRNSDRILIIEDKINKHDLTCFIRSSRAVALPFLLVPSEIPLSVIETLAKDKPILISETGGTSDFVGKAGITVSPNDIDSLAEGILAICSNEALYETMLKETRNIISRLPTWEKLSQNYLEFTERMLEKS